MLSVVIGSGGAAEYLRTIGHPNITAQAVRCALSRARKARSAGKEGTNLFPEPDFFVDLRTPAWKKQTLRRWKPVGRGVGGGRPRVIVRLP